MSYITYMCVRYIDYINSEDMVQKFMGILTSWIKKRTASAIKRGEVENIIHVLSYTYKFATLIKYYSGEFLVHVNCYMFGG